MNRTRRLAAAVGLVVMTGAVIGLASRDSARKLRAAAFATDARLSIGVIVDDQGSSTAAGRDTLRGIELWRAKLQLQGGIEYNNGQLAAVQIRVRRGVHTTVEAAAAARELVRAGAQILVPPLPEDELTAVADVARRARVLLIAPRSRPVQLPRSPVFTFLTRPPSPFNAALDAAFTSAIKEDPERESIRVGVVLDPGPFAPVGRLGAATAEARGFPTHVARTTDGVGAALEAVRRNNPDILLVAAPFDVALRWKDRLGRADDPPWVLVDDDVSSALDSASEARALVATAWSPAVAQGGPVFAPREFKRLYLDRYGRWPSMAAAGGAAVGTLVTSLVQRARSTDRTRMLRARNLLRVDSIFGVLQFRRGEQVAPSAALTLLDRGVPRAVFPVPLNLKLLDDGRPDGTDVAASVTVPQLAPLDVAPAPPTE